MSFLAPIKDKKGVALFIVLASMAMLAIFVSEITYTAQINQKLAYDRLDQVKAQSLAKSGLRIALLRIRAYSELKKQIGKVAGAAGSVASAAVNSAVPKAVMEKIWSEPITIPFSGDISSLPGTIKDALTKFRKDSGLEGKLYISIQAQSNKFNLNSTLPSFAAIASASPSATPDPNNGNRPITPPANNATPNPSSTPVGYSPEESRKLLGQQITTSFQKKFESDEKFRDQYRSFRIEDLVQEILGWSDLSYDSPREQMATLPFKKAPFYHVSELHYLQSMDDQIYDLLSDQFTAGVASLINVNTIKEPVLRALVPQMTTEEVDKFFKFRDSTGAEAVEAGGKAQAPGGGDDNSFKTDADFFKYLKEKVQFFSGSASKTQEFQDSLTKRGIQITTDETNFLVHIEATVQQTKKTMEAMVSIVPDAGSGQPSPSPTPFNPNAAKLPNNGSSTGNRSNLKITQLRFL